MVEKKLRDNTVINNLRDLLDAIDPGYEALTSLAIKEPGQGNEDKIRQSDVYQIEINDQEAFDMKADIDRVLQIIRGELLFVFNGMDRYFHVREQPTKAWSDNDVKNLKRYVNKKAKTC